MSSLLAQKIRVRLLFMYFFLFDSQECPSARVFTRGSTIVFTPCIHANIKVVVVLNRHIGAPMIVMHSAHNERKRETIVKILLEN